VTQFGALFAFWLVLSGEFRPLFVVMGAVFAALVTALTNTLIRDVVASTAPPAGNRVGRAGWFVAYLVWMAGRIALASTQVAIFALRPSLPFQPRFVRFRTGLEQPFSRVLLANSITLVPGTMTVRLEGDEFLVHCLIPGAAADLESARMQNMIGRFMGEATEDPPEMTYGPLIEEAVR
jgi:multicomponent Na+:H+ antiporter subunit E